MAKRLRLSIRLALGLFLAAALLSQSSPVGAANVPVPAAGSLSAVNTKGDPVGLWSITWTTSSSYVYDDTREITFFRWDFNLTQSGSTLVRQYADGTWDNTSFNWHVTDDYNESYNQYSGCPGCCDGGLESGDHTWSITDPDRYTGTLDHVLNVTPEQLPGGTWRASVPFDTLLDLSGIYTYTIYAHGEDRECGVSWPWGPWTSQEHLPFISCALPFPAFLEGDAQGKDFTYHDTFSGLYNKPYPTNGEYGCQGAYGMSGSTATLSIDITVHRLLGGIFVKNESGNPVEGAQVFRNGVLAGKTDAAGALSIDDLATGDKLVARKQIVEVPSVKNNHNQDSTQNWSRRVYITSLDIPQSGDPVPWKVTNPSAVQTLTLKKSNPLIGFNIVASVEWDANASYLNELQQGFQSASDYLYDASDGQMLFERVTIYDNNQNMDSADYQMRASNQEWPRANVDGINHNNLWHVYLGRDWDGAGGNHGSWTASDGYRTQIHEFGHYGLGLYDSYYIFIGAVKYYSDCTSSAIRTNLTPDLNATIMDYQYNASEFSMLNVAGLWSNQCEDTDQWDNLGESDWQAIALHYQDSNSPERWKIKTPADHGGVVAGPHVQPVSGWSSVAIGSNASSGVCEPPLTYRVINSSGTPVQGATMMLVKGARTIDQGKTPLNGEVTVLGATDGDLLLISQWGLDLNLWGSDLGIDSTVIACGASSAAKVESIAPTDMVLEPAPFSVYISTAPGAGANQLKVIVKASTSLSAAPETSLTQNGAAATVPMLLSYDAGLQAYTGTVTLDASLPSLGNILAKATDTASHIVEVGTQFALDPVAVGQDITVWSPDGQAELYLPAGSISKAGRLSIVPGQSAGSVPDHLVMLSGPYTIQADEGLSLVNNANLSLNYLDPSGSLSNVGVSSAQLYRWDGLNWQALSSTASQNEQMVSAVINTFGTYALMAERQEKIYLPLVIR